MKYHFARDIFERKPEKPGKTDITAIEALADLDIPKSPQEFYEDFGFLEHPDHSAHPGEPVKKLAPYQIQWWEDSERYSRQLAVKSHKIGFTTTNLIQNFQSCLRYGNGREFLVIAQSVQHAREHLYTLRKLILSSVKYRKFLISAHTGLLLRDEVTRVTMLFLHNPKKPAQPTRIIGLGPHIRAIESWKNVFEIHATDLTMTGQTNDAPTFGAMTSRLANTNGKLRIETIPGFQHGKIYEIWQKSKMKTEETARQPEGQFKPYEIPYREAIAAGVITKEFIEAERVTHGALFPMLYECEFLAPGNVWYGEPFDVVQDDIGL